MPVEVLLQSLLSGILMGFVYALIAAGLSLIFGLMEIVNFAHGEYLMLSMFVTFWLYTLWRIDPLLSLPVSALCLFGVGWLTYHGLVKKILQAPMLVQIFATFGLAVFLRSSAQFLWSPDFRLITEPLVQGRIDLGGSFWGCPSSSPVLVL
jgi:branched-chain amino acid transport system permease protein